MDEQLIDYSTNSLAAEDIWVNFSRPVPTITESVAASLPVTRVDEVTMQMEDMEVTIQDQDPQPLLAMTEGIYNPGEGSKPPFLSIPSPSILHAWSQAFLVGANPQGSASSSGEGVSGLRPPSQDLTPEQLALLGSAPPSGCFNGIAGLEQGTEDIQSSDSEDIGQAAGD